MVDEQALRAKCENAFEFAGRQLRHLIETYPDSFPMYGHGCLWLHDGEALSNWLIFSDNAYCYIMCGAVDAADSKFYL